MEEKKIYSLNLLAYVSYRTSLKPQIKQDADGQFYGLYPECRGVAYAICDFRKEKCKVELHRYLEEYREIRKTIREQRGVQDA